MRLGEPDVSVNEEDIQSLDNEAVEEAIQDGMPESMALLSARDEDRLRKTVQHYFAWRKMLFSPESESPRTARLAARRRVANRLDLYEQSIDQIAMKLYPEQVRPASKCFQSSLELAYIHYQRATRSSITDIQEQFLRLRGSLLAISQIPIPPLRTEELSVEDCFTNPPSTDSERYKQYQSLLNRGKDAIDESRSSFLVGDVEASETGFGLTWTKLKEAVSVFLRFEEGFHTSNCVYPSSDLDNVRLIAYGPQDRSDDRLVSLKLTYYPIGLLQLETRSFAMLGLESLPRKWCHGDLKWGEGYPLERNHIRGYTEGLMNMYSASKGHIEKNSCIDTPPTDWVDTH